MQAYCLRFLLDGAAKVELSPAPLGIKKTQVNLRFYYSLVEPQIFSIFTLHPRKSNKKCKHFLLAFSLGWSRKSDLN